MASSEFEHIVLEELGAALQLQAGKAAGAAPKRQRSLQSAAVSKGAERIQGTCAALQEVARIITTYAEGR